MTTTEMRQQPEFQQLEKEITSHFAQAHSKFQELAEKFPAPKGFTWMLSETGTIGCCPLSLEEDA
jgi:hypothetical protein